MLNCFVYTLLDDGTAAITGYRGSETGLFIPRRSTDTLSVFIPDSVRFIGLHAFDCCEKLTLSAGASDCAQEYARAHGIVCKAQAHPADSPAPYATRFLSETKNRRPSAADS